MISTTRQGLAASFDVDVEATSQGVKLRASRVQLEESVDGDSGDIAAAAAAASGTLGIGSSGVNGGAGLIDHSVNSVGRCLIKANVLGAIAKNTVKREVPGLVRMHPDFHAELRTIGDYHDPELTQALQEFVDLHELPEVSIFGLSASALRSYTMLIDARFSHLDNDLGAGAYTEHYYYYYYYYCWKFGHFRLVVDWKASTS
jgi:hypothetical protein